MLLISNWWLVSDLRLRLVLLLLHVGSRSSIRSLALTCHCRCLTTATTNDLSLLLFVHCDHLEGAQHLLFELRPLDDGIVQFDLGEIDEHAGDFWGFHFTHKLFDVLVDSINNDILFGLAVRCLLVFLGSEHVSDLNLVCSRILAIDKLWTLTVVLTSSERRHLANGLWCRLLLLLWTMHLLRLYRHLVLQHIWSWVGRWRTHLVILLSRWVHRVVPRHHLLVVVHTVMVVAMSLVVVAAVMVTVWTLVVASIVLVSLHTVVVAAGAAWHLVLGAAHLAIGLGWVGGVEGVGPSLLVRHATIVDLER